MTTIEPGLIKRTRHVLVCLLLICIKLRVVTIGCRITNCLQECLTAFKHGLSDELRPIKFIGVGMVVDKRRCHGRFLSFLPSTAASLCRSSMTKVFHHRRNMPPDAYAMVMNTQNVYNKMLQKAGRTTR